MKKTLCLLLCFSLLCLPFFSGAAAPEGKPTLVSTDLRISSDFSVGFVVEVPAGTVRAGVYVEGTDYRAVRRDDGRYEVVYTGIAPDKLSREFSVVPYCVFGGVVHRGSTYYFSVRDYAMRMILREDTSDDVREILVAALNFGAAAQRYLSYRKQNPANSYLTAELRRVPVREYRSVLTNTPGEVRLPAEISSASMVVKDAAAFKFYVAIAGQENLRENGGAGIPKFSDYTPKREADLFSAPYLLEIADNPAFSESRTYPLQKLADSPGYLVVTEGIHAADYSTTFYVRLQSVEGTGDVWQYSVESYASRNLSQMNAEGREMVCAMMALGDTLRKQNFS